MGKKIVSVDVEEAKARLIETRKKVTSGVKEKLNNTKESALGRLMDAGIALTEKQLSLLKKFQSKYTNS
jgi:hypothetical protein